MKYYEVIVGNVAITTCKETELVYNALAYNVPRFGEISEEQFHKINEQSTCKKPVSKKIFTYKLKYDIDLIPV
jgi:hypothetical protein